MDLYHSRLTQDDLNDLIIKYKIPRDLHPWLPSEEFVMSKLPDDAIGIYHRMFDFSGVRIPFSSFLLSNIIGPCANKSGFFLIDRRAISDAMVWRHPDAAIDDPKPAAGSFSMADVRRLSAHVIKLRDMPEGVLVLSGLSRVWKSRVFMGIHDFLYLLEWTGSEFQEEPHHDIRPTLQRLPFYCTPPAVADTIISDLIPEDLAVGTPSSKILAKDGASQKLKASTSGATSSHVAKRTSDGDDDACVEISLVTPLRYAAVIPSSGNQGRSSTTPVAEDSRGKDIMADDVVASSVDGVARNCEFTCEEWDAPYRPTFGVLTKEVFKDPAVCKTVVDQFPTPDEMVRVEALSEDRLTAKMSVLHCMMMSHGGELLARYRGLLQSHHEYVQSANSKLKGYEEGVAGVAGLELQVSTLKKQVSRLNDKLASSDASFAKSKAKGKERKKKIKSLTKSLDNLHAEVARLSATLNQATVLEAAKDEEILRLKTTPPEFASFFHGQYQDLVRKFLASDEFSRVQGELLSLAASVGFERGLSMHRTKDEFAAVLKKMANFMPGAQDRLAEAPLVQIQTDADRCRAQIQIAYSQADVDKTDESGELDTK
ncbi:hypothetical protein Tco_0324390 [Tanacetum coccineum]